MHPPIAAVHPATGNLLICAVSQSRHSQLTQRGAGQRGGGHILLLGQAGSLAHGVDQGALARVLQRRGDQVGIQRKPAYMSSQQAKRVVAGSAHLAAGKPSN